MTVPTDHNSRSAIEHPGCSAQQECCGPLQARDELRICPTRVGLARYGIAAVLLIALTVATGLGQSTHRDEITKGQSLFNGKGNCSVCHTIGRRVEDRRARGPDLTGIGGRAAGRAKQFKIDGPYAATRYLVRSIVRPRDDVVEGYNPAPESWLPSSLTDAEIRSLVVYLQSLGGRPDPDNISLPKDYLAVKRQEFQQELKLFSIGDPAKGKALFHDPKGKASCINCHKIDGKGKDVCPDLTTVNRVQRPGYIFESILDSSEFLVRGYRQVIILDEDGRVHTGLPTTEDKTTITLVVDQEGKKTEVIEKDTIELRKFSKTSQMPGNLSEVLTAKQLMDVVAYLLKHEQLAATELAEKAKSTTIKSAVPRNTPPPSLAVFTPLTKDQQTYRLAMEKGDPVVGRRIYGHYCVMCHGTKGDGNGFNAVNLKTKPANHTDNRRLSKTEDLLLHGVITRGGMQTGRSFLMPPWGGVLTDRQRWDLVAYIRTLHTEMRPWNARTTAAKHLRNQRQFVNNRATP